MRKIIGKAAFHLQLHDEPVASSGRLDSIEASKQPVSDEILCDVLKHLLPSRRINLCSATDSSHSQMCKFEDVSSPGYDVVAEAVQRYEPTPGIIATNVIARRLG